MLNDLKTILDSRTEYQSYLYQRGYLISTDKSIDVSCYPFYENWNVTVIGNYAFYIHNNQHFYFKSYGDTTLFFIGQVYNPFTMQVFEQDILESLCECFEEELFNKINELSGNFLFGKISHNEILFLSDATCMLTAYYGSNNGFLYISQYAQLIGDICNLEQDVFVKELVEYRFYNLFGRILPGDLSPFTSFRHTIPNFVYTYNCNSNTFEYERFYYFDNIDQSSNIDQNVYKTIIDKASNILHNNLQLISKKWNRPAISLTGGCDSKTTLSCANGLYDRFTYFSYISSKAESVDAYAARDICKLLDLNHRIDIIPNDNSNYKDIEIWRKILTQNCGNIGIVNENDIRKRIYYVENDFFDVEVKSWASEIVRGNYSKRFDNFVFPNRPKARYLSAMHKALTFNKELLLQSDNYFEHFLKKYYSDNIFDKCNWVELLYWEYRESSLNGLVISNEHSLSYDIVVPFNNRKLITLLLSTPKSYRLNDKCHKDIQKLMNYVVADTNISVTNLKHTSKRAKIEKFYLKIMSFI